jgi:hypothetical protein
MGSAEYEVRLGGCTAGVTGALGLEKDKVAIIVMRTGVCCISKCWKAEVALAGRLQLKMLANPILIQVSAVVIHMICPSES